MSIGGKNRVYTKRFLSLRKRDMIAFHADYHQSIMITFTDIAYIEIVIYN